MLLSNACLKKLTDLCVDGFVLFYTFSCLLFLFVLHTFAFMWLPFYISFLDLLFLFYISSCLFGCHFIYLHLYGCYYL